MVYALLDSGSNRDVISQSLITNLKLDSWTEYLRVKTLDTMVEGERQLTSMRIKSVDASYAVDCDIPPAKRNWSSYPHLSSLVFEDHDSELEFIIGCAHDHTWMAPDVVRGANNQLLGVMTSFGWTVVGPFAASLLHQAPLATHCPPITNASIKTLTKSSITISQS